MRAIIRGEGGERGQTFCCIAIKSRRSIETGKGKAWLQIKNQDREQCV
jgi:hypothetical protein